ncbi:hypothetical protein BDZ45DRAFT_140111 [Acephala macrosclerotiorum]|nr:hypothetical protein BDZ45DRAFT_140111 [Acephala macrosclerotiorum]
MQRDSLCNSLTTIFCVPSYFAITKDNLDANLLYLNVIVHCATLQVHLMVQKLARAALAIFELAKLASQSKIRNYHPATFFCIYNAMVVLADCFLVKRDAKLSIPITFLIDFMKFLSDQSQAAGNLFRDFETEYPSLIIEFSSETQKTFTAVLML